MTRRKIFEKISIQPAEIENPNLVYKFGYKRCSRLSENEWDICKKIYHKLSENIDEECVYGLLVHLITNTFLVITSSRQPQ